MTPTTLPARDFDRVIDMLCKRGFELPFLVSAIGSDGHFIFGRYDASNAAGKPKCQVLGGYSEEHSKGRGVQFALPIFFTVIDATGQSACLVHKHDGRKRATSLLSSHPAP